MLDTTFKLGDDKREELAKLVGMLGKPTMVTYDSNYWIDLREDEEDETFAETVSKGSGGITWVDPLYLTQDFYDRLLENYSVISINPCIYDASYIMSDKIYDFE